MPLPTQPVYFLPLSETALAAFLDVGQIPASALERAGLFAAALCQGRAHHSAALMEKVGRTHRSVEFKHQNMRENLG